LLALQSACNLYHDNKENTGKKELIMFFVNDNYEQRMQMISRFVNEKDICIAIILATIDFEWTIRRAIIALGYEPNKTIRKELESCHGLDAYKKAWKKHVSDNKKLTEKNVEKQSLLLSTLIPEWDAFKDAFKLRHKIVHGVQGSTGIEYGKDKCQLIMNATKAIIDFATVNDINLYNRLPVRRVKK